VQIATTPPVNVSQNSGLSESPAAAVSVPPATISRDLGGVARRRVPWFGDHARPHPPLAPSVYVVWADKPASSSDYNVLFSTSQDGGLSFSAAKNLSNSAYWASFPQIAVSGDDVYVVWKRHTIIGGGDGEIFFVKSTDRGGTFTAPINFSNNTADSRPPRLAVSGDTVYVVWADAHSSGTADISLRRSVNRGATFSPTTTLASNGRGLYSEPRIAVSGTDVYVVWSDTNTDISLCKSADGGATFGAPSNLSNNSAASWYPELSAQGSDVYVAWFDTGSAAQNVSFTRSSNNGVSFSAPMNVSPNSWNAMNVDLQASSPKVYVLWDDVSAGRRQVFFSRSANNGASFQAPVNLSKSGAALYSPLLSAEGDELYVSWALETGSVGGVPNFDIVLAASDDGGGTFSPSTNLTVTPNNRSVDATTVIADRVAYSAWSEGSLTDADIFFSTAVLYEPAPLVPKDRIDRPIRPIPDLPYKVDLYVPSRHPPLPPGPPPPFKRRFPWRSGR
jgi:hypothetical protein